MSIVSRRYRALLLAAAVAVTIAAGAAAQSQSVQTKPKAAVYIMGNPEGRDALRSAVNTFLIKSGKYQMIAVDAIDVAAKEQKRQMSGSVSDGDIAALGRDAGAQYVCVVERSEFDGASYVATRIVGVQSKAAELADIVEVPPGGKIIDIIQWQIGSMLGAAAGSRPGSAQSAPSANYSGTYYIVSKNGASFHTSGANTDNGTNIVLWNGYDSRAPQAQWSFALQNDGTYIITNVKSGKVIDVPQSSKTSGTELIIYSRHGDANQRWRVVRHVDGYVSIISVSSGLAIDIPNYSNQNWTKVVQSDYHGGKEQQFRLVPVN